VTLKNNSSETIRVSVPVGPGESRTYTLAPGATYDTFVVRGSALTGDSPTLGTVVSPSSTVVTGPGIIEFNAVRTKWDTSFFLNGNVFLLQDTIINDPNKVLKDNAAGTTEIPYSPAVKYTIDIDGDVIMIAVGKASLGFPGPSSSIYGLYDKVRKVRVTLDLAATPRTIAFTDIATNLPISPATTFDPNDPSQYPLRVVASFNGTTASSRSVRLLVNLQL